MFVSALLGPNLAVAAPWGRIGAKSSLGAEQRRTDPERSIGLHVLEDMLIQVRSDARGTMAEALGHDLQCHALVEQQRRAGVSQPVHRDRR
jgi:hypothetical protein